MTPPFQPPADPQSPLLASAGITGVASATGPGAVVASATPRVRKGPIPAVGPRLKFILWAMFAILGLLGANSVYLASVTAMDWWTGHEYQNWFYQYMFLGHLVLGLGLIVPFVVFSIGHIVNTRQRKNKRAIRVGWALFVASLVILFSGLLLTRAIGIELKHPLIRSVMYWAHVTAPLAGLWLYWLHRLAGPKIRWKWGLSYAAAVAAGVALMIAVHNQDPRNWNQIGPKSGEQYFFPSLARTDTGNFIPAAVLDNDEYCLKCHADAYKGWFHSAHHFSSFNNPAYLASVRETRKVSFERDGNMQGARFCAGCHDPVPFFSGAFDDPKFDDVNHPTAQAGITCTVCHSITHVNSTRGNADFTIEEPQHYPFASSDNAILQWINNQLVKAKPEFHKRTFLKDFHKSAEFCSTCHKVHLPYALNHYKEFLRGQNHYDSYHLSGVSGHGARSFYYPEKAQANCNGCHMPLSPSSDFGAKYFGDSKDLSIHNHLFMGANTALPHWRNEPEFVAKHQEFLQGITRVDLFGIKEDGSVTGRLHAPLRPQVPELTPGKSYLLETVVRTLKMGHHLTQGTVDSNELWLDVTVTSGDRVIGRSGRIDEQQSVDPWAHFLNVFMLDKDGNRIDRRNAQDIFIPLYNNQIPPGAGQTVHYALDLPADLTEPVTIELKLQYRKFDKIYTDYVARNRLPGDLPYGNDQPGRPPVNDLPVTTLATDRITLPLVGGGPVENPESKIPTWQRWNDYGIGLLLKGKAELRQAAEAFAEVEALKRYDGPLNLGRVYFAEGRLDEAVEALARAQKYTDPAAPPWTVAWLAGLVNREQGRLPEAEANFRKVLEDSSAEMLKRGFDFSQDYEVRNLLGLVLFDQAKQIRQPELIARQQELLREAARHFHLTLGIDSENATAHYELGLIFAMLGDEAKAKEHRELHARYKLDDNARDRAIGLARQKYPAAAKASEPLVIYRLNSDAAAKPADAVGADSQQVQVDPQESPASTANTESD